MLFYKTAEMVKDNLNKIGIDNTQLYETPGYPIVYGEKIIDEKLPTVLIYGHYDVQPPDPLELWDSEPFKPEPLKMIKFMQEVHVMIKVNFLCMLKQLKL